MYKFICINGHTSHSASREQRDMSCPECGERARLQTELDPEFDAEVRSISSQRISNAQKRNAAGKAVRKTIERLKSEGKTIVEIADLTGLNENRVREFINGEYPPSQIATIIKNRDLSETEEFKVEGPWGHRGVDGYKTPVYIFVPGGERKDVGEATVKVRGSMKFEVELYEDADQAAFDVPMRFVVRKKELSENDVRALLDPRRES